MHTAVLSPVFGLPLVGRLRMDDDDTPAVAAPPPRPHTALPLQDWLLAVAERQDEHAFERLYQALAPRVLLLARRILRDAASAEEVVEDCFWQVWRQALRFDPERGCAEAWVMTLARSRALDAWRTRERAQGELVSLDALQEDGHTLPEAADDGPDAAELLEAGRHHEGLHRALQQLKPLPRQLLALAFFRGLTHDEIAEQTGLALGTVKSHIRRALAGLQQVLAAEGGAP
ncbi:sigma-70 family RNA polymerase sigma factor [Inhella sp.]|uniref:sigma-70 family RNA polymerase sigma factor n=1 Tax=Inhella sp. TaxID=1921806 RepID=UPI0035B3E91E